MTEALTGNWHYPTEILFGTKRINELTNELTRLNIKKPLVVADPNLVTLPIFDNLKNNLAELNLFQAFQANPTADDIIAGVKHYHEVQADGIIAFGGGSALDTAKTMALMVRQTRPLWDFEDVGDNYLRANAEAIAPIIAIPTTAGTGAEVGRAAVIVDEQAHTKRLIFHPRMLPSSVIADPELTVALPKGLTAATGMDALAHCLEAYSAPGFHPMADGIAVEGLRLIKRSLLSAYQQPSDNNARAELLAAAIMGGSAFQKGLGAVHALSHPLGGMYGTHHGLLNAILMPYVLVFNREYLADRMIRLAAYLDLAEHSFTGVLNWLLALRKALDLPHTLREVDIDDARLDELIPLALKDPSCGGNPRALDAAGLQEIFEKALVGDV